MKKIRIDQARLRAHLWGAGDGGELILAVAADGDYEIVAGGELHVGEFAYMYMLPNLSSLLMEEEASARALDEGAGEEFDAEEEEASARALDEGAGEEFDAEEFEREFIEFALRQINASLNGEAPENASYAGYWRGDPPTNIRFELA